MVFNKTEKTRFNDVFRPYTDVKESIGEFYDFKSLEKFVNLCKNLITQEWQFKKAKEFYKSNYNPKLRVAISKNNLKKGNDNYHNVGDDNVRQIHTVSTITRGIKQSNLVSFLPENKATKATNIKQGVKHPTVKPIKLMEYLLELTTNKNDLILDPFMGSGTTGIACANLNRNFIGYELDKDYFEIAKKRINEAEKKHYEKLF
jgi:DNA modification methylase